MIVQHKRNCRADYQRKDTIMTNIGSDETKKIPAGRWAEWCGTFTNGNRGRLIKIELVSDELGAEPLADGAALIAVDFDPAGKGKNFVISTGDETAPSTHVIARPVALWQAQGENGLVVSLEIEAEGGSRTIITLN
jgi:hypothetical protein